MLTPNRGEYVPNVGEKVLLRNRLGVFVIEGVDADSKTASLRMLRRGALLNDVEWCTIKPLDDKTRALLRDIVKSEEFRKILSRQARSE